MATTQELIKRTSEYVEAYMARYDGSHDFSHIKRVLSLSHYLYNEIKKLDPEMKLDLATITLSALLHDVGDHKYLKPNEDGTTMVQDLLLSVGAAESLAQKVQAICHGVSFTSEIKDPQFVKDLIVQFPELGVVQDADRLDGIGAVGVGRVFMFGGAKTKLNLAETIGVFEARLFKYESMMKTEPGRVLAKERTSRLRAFQAQWEEEVGIPEIAESILNPPTAAI